MQVAVKFLFYKRFPPITTYIQPCKLRFASCGHCLFSPPKYRNLRGLWLRISHSKYFGIVLESLQIIHVTYHGPTPLFAHLVCTRPLCIVISGTLSSTGQHKKSKCSGQMPFIFFAWFSMNYPSLFTEWFTLTNFSIRWWNLDKHPLSFSVFNHKWLNDTDYKDIFTQNFCMTQFFFSHLCPEKNKI